MRLAVVLAPLLALGFYVLWRAIRGRPLSRFTLNVVVALFLLAYLFITAALGVFWVARMDLPAFDWHYLFGYAVVLLATLHVAFQLRLLSSFFRRVSPAALLVADKSAFRPGVRIAAGTLAAATLLGPLGWLLVATVRDAQPARVLTDAGRAHPAKSAAGAEGSENAAGARVIWIERDGRRISAFDYLHEQSSYSRTGVFRTVGIAPERPPDVKIYAGAREVVLPEPAVDAGVSLNTALHAGGMEGDRIVVGAGAVSLDDLSAILQYTAGVTSAAAESGGISLRAAASSGALYPVDLYVFTPESRELARGPHYYEPKRHALFALGAPVERLAAALAEPELVRGAPLTFVTAVTYDRTVSKYDVRSYRYVALDAGHVAANLLLAAAARGFACRPLAVFDDVVASAALALDAGAEGVLLVVPCRLGRPATNVAHSAERELELPSLPERADQLELTRLSHRLTSVRLGDARVAPRVAPPQARSTASGPTLPAAAPLARDLFETIANRRSFREFSNEALELGELSALLAAASRRPALRSTPLVELYLAVRRVAGLEPGIYRYHADRTLLERVTRGDRAQAIARAGLSQALLERAAAVFFWTLAGAGGSLDGARDYRTAQLEAGFGGEYVYLAASALGLGACGVGAFYDDEIGAVLEHAGQRPRAVYLQALGRR